MKYSLAPVKMARQSDVKHKDRLMAQEKSERRGKPGQSRSRRESGSQMSLSDQDTRAKATMKDIEELYSVLQDLVPKPGKQERRKTRGRMSGTDTDTTRADCEDSDSNGRNVNINNNNGRTAGDLKSLEAILDRESKEKTEHNPVVSNDRMVASDTELEFCSSSEHHQQVQRCASLPAYDDVESANEMVDGNDESTPKRSLFLLFRRRRRRPRTKAQKKKRSSWRTFLTSLSLKRRSSKKQNKKANNKPSQDVLSTKDAEPANGSPRRRQSREKTTKKLSSTHDEGVQKTTQDVSTIAINGDTARESFSKQKAPEPPAQGNVSDLETRSDEVNRKLSTWYKHVVKETTSLNTSALHARYSRSCESLLTDSEILRNRGSSDTESTAAVDIRTRVSMNKIRVRKSRAMRNRRKERARWRSLPNVKLVSYALQKAAGQQKSTGGDDDKEEEPTEVSNHDEVNRQRLPTKYTTTVKSVEAILSFGNTSEKSSESPPMNDFMMIQRENSSSWLSRQCSKTTVSCIRPLQLNLFYSESPSREAIFRSEKPKFQFKGSKYPNVTTTQAAGASAFTIRQTSSQRRRKRRSFKRQPRLPHQSPFYLPSENNTNNTSSSSSKFSFNLNSQGNSLEVDSPDHEKKVFRVEAINTSERRRVPKLYWESEDSGWASMDKSTASRADTAVQTEPVVIMTVASKTRSNRFLPHLRNDSDGQSEA